MKITFAHLCDHALTDANGKLSVIGIFNAVLAHRMPHIHPQFFIAFQIELNYAEVGRSFPVRIEVVDADGVNLMRAGSVMQVDGPATIGDHPGIGQAIRINGLRFVRPGAHNVNFFLEERLAFQLEFAVVLVRQDDQPEQQHLPLPPGPEVPER